jgi:two-component system, chemotaxis family, protein-glutamate methylesterase/glutaminase
MTGLVRILIVDDSAVARRLLRAHVEASGEVEVIGEARNGRQAVEMAQRLRPDLITMDLEMPVMNGLDAIEEIMALRAVPILVVTDAADAGPACEAVRRGALEVALKPDYSIEQVAALVARIRLLAGVAMITRRRPPAVAVGPPPVPEHQVVLVPPVQHVQRSSKRVIGIAASTGGPQALTQILPRFPADFGAPVLVAQHISDGFAAGMAEWLAGLCQLPVRLASGGEPLEPGVIWLSPSEADLAVNEAHRLELCRRQEGAVYRPSCDVLFDSLARAFGEHAVGVVLTGMGRDGLIGLGAIRRAGGATFAQDEASSTVFGMNRRAIEAGVVQNVLPVGEIADALVGLACCEVANEP